MARKRIRETNTSGRSITTTWRLERSSAGRIYMIRVYAKGAKETLTREEENELRRLATELRNEEC